MSLARRASGSVLAAALALALSAPAAWAAPVSEEQVHAIAADLRCVVCQNLSVADSPSETARQMRDLIRERLVAGDTPDQVRAYFVDKYGLWVLLKPPARGFNLLVWVVPPAALVLGLALVGILMFRWSRRGRRGPAPEPPAPDSALRARIRREIEDLDR